MAIDGAGFFRNGAKELKNTEDGCERRRPLPPAKVTPSAFDPLMKGAWDRLQGWLGTACQGMLAPVPAGLGGRARLVENVGAFGGCGDARANGGGLGRKQRCEGQMTRKGRSKPSGWMRGGGLGAPQGYRTGGINPSPFPTARGRGLEGGGRCGRGELYPSLPPPAAIPS